MTIAVFGYGRFGRVLVSLLAPEHAVKVHDPALVRDSEPPNVTFVSEQEALACDTIFYAVPIRLLEDVVARHAATFRADAKARLLVDTLSVKLHPKEVFERHLPATCRALLTHPMFGPDSLREHGLQDLPIVMDRFSASEDDYTYWKQFFCNKDLRVIAMTADEHDRKAAWSQGVTHFIGRVLEEIDLQPTDIDTVGTKRLLEIREQVSNDTWELFTDLQTKNRYTIDMRVKLGAAVDSVYNRLLPNRVVADRWVVGIQGGKGSFNEEAAHYYLKRNGVASFEIKHLYTTAEVLRALHEGNVDRGQFAVHNSTGGMVEESVEAMASHKFRIKEQFSIKIEHTLMVHADASLDEVDRIMAHPQVFKQCRNTLDQKYARLQRVSGEGELIDSARAAEALAQGQLAANHGVIGSKILAQIFDLRIVEEGLQDLADNYTSFLWVERP